MKFLSAFLLFIGFILHMSQGDIYTPQDYRRFGQTCMKLLRVSPEDLLQMGRDMYCVIRCSGIMSKFYDDDNGTNWDTVSRQLAGKTGFQASKQATIECVKALPPEEDVCIKSYQHYHCGMKAYKEHVREA